MDDRKDQSIEVVTENSGQLVKLLSQEKTKMVAETKPDNESEISTLGQIENDLASNPNVEAALFDHFEKVWGAVSEQKDSNLPSIEDKWAHAVSGPTSGPYAEKKYQLGVKDGQGRKEDLVSISALEGKYPTETSGRATHVDDYLTDAVWSLGREIGHNGRGNFYITRHAFDVVKDLYIKSKGSPS